MTMKYFFIDQPTLSKYHMHPLGKYLNAFAGYMHEQGFARETGRRKVSLIFKFSRWLKRYAVRSDELTLEIIDRYVHRKGRKYRPSQEEYFTLKQFAEFLHKQGAIKHSLEAPNDSAYGQKSENALTIQINGDIRIDNILIQALLA